MAFDPKLAIYDDLLHKWQKKINLVSSQTLGESRNRHFEDSLQLLPYIEGAKTVVDLGSGAGFPGLVLAISNPNLSVLLIESDQKKCSFLRTVSRETGVPVIVINDRIEKAQLDQKIDIVTARALADLSLLFDYALPFLSNNPDVKYVFLKGRNYQQELDQLKQKWRYSVNVQASKTDTESAVLIFTNIQKCE